jgi:hypothetical protein
VPFAFEEDEDCDPARRPVVPAGRPFNLADGVRDLVRPISAPAGSPPSSGDASTAQPGDASTASGEARARVEEAPPAAEKKGPGTPENVNKRELFEILRRHPELAEVATKPFASRVWDAARVAGINLATASIALYEAAAKSPLCDGDDNPLHGHALERAIIGFVLQAKRNPVGDAAALGACLALYPEELGVDPAFGHEVLGKVAATARRPLADATALVRSTLDAAIAGTLRGRDLRRKLVDDLKGSPSPALPAAAASPPPPPPPPEERRARLASSSEALARILGQGPPG